MTLQACALTQVNSDKDDDVPCKLKDARGFHAPMISPRVDFCLNCVYARATVMEMADEALSLIPLCTCGVVLLNMKQERKIVTCGTHVCMFGNSWALL